ncbi:hypothetical protein CAEBREN_22304 [Caenorhabditis brenneri]|uniref:DUF38 domain-containing protein n=1 Tax=Caenorhabditis brenneri TaxID=135651 RepID=G0MME4_CAEBE|nr:hypothetical protein CAEBREN_22304 [Caenorhabditis brenneri]
MAHVPEGFLQFCLKFEYFKRNSTSIARKNVQKVIDSTLPDLVFPELEPKFTYNPPPPSEEPKEEEAPRPLKRKHASSGSDPSKSTDSPSKNRKTTSENQESTGFILSDPDSDDFVTNEMESEPENADETGQCTLKKVKFLYENFAANEFWLLEYQNRDATLEEYLGVMAAQRITKTRYFPILSLFVCDDDKFRVLTGYRKMTMSFECHELKGWFRMSISYMSCQDGCLILYGDTVRHIKKWKYQSVAAKDFFYLVRDPEMVFRTLEFDVESYRKWDPAVWSFSSFHHKIHKYLVNTQLVVDKFNMKVFNNYAVTICGQEILMLVLRHLKPENLKKVALRMWNATGVLQKRSVEPDDVEFLSVLYNDEHWKYIKTLDINDPQIRIHRNSFSRFFHLDDFYSLRQNDFEPLVIAFARIEVFDHHLSSFHVNEEFDFRVAHRFLIGEFEHEIASMDNTKPEYKEYSLRNGVKIIFQEVQRIVQFAREFKR